MVGKIPSVVQLPGGIRLSGVMFRVIEHDVDGRPLKFEILKPGERPISQQGIWTLYADEAALRTPGQRKPGQR